MTKVAKDRFESFEPHRKWLCCSSWPESKEKSRLNSSSENDEHQDENVAVFGDSDLREVVVISGPVFSEVSVVFESGE